MPFPWASFGWATLAAAAAIVVAFAISFVIASKIGRHNVVGTTWGIGFLVATLAAEAVALALPDAHGDLRRAVVTALVAVWGLRLAAHVGLHGKGQGEDPRYVEMLDGAMSNRAVHALRVVYLPQALATWAISLPLQVAVVGGDPLGVLGWFGVAVWTVGFCFEAGGDWQLTRFKADPDNTGKGSTGACGATPGTPTISATPASGGVSSCSRPRSGPASQPSSRPRS